jgi:hypothetical protein
VIGQGSGFESALGSLSEEVSDAQLEAALDELRKAFVQRNINYRVFSTTVQIRSSKWNLSL